MPFNIDLSLPYTDHFAKYGFAVVKGLVDKAFCKQAVQRIGEIVNCAHLPVTQWTSENAGVQYMPFRDGKSDPVLERVYEQTRLTDAVHAMFGGRGQWNEKRNYYIFLRPYEPKATAALGKGGEHVDFGGQHIPILYRGFTFQVLLHDSEPFSGNITVYPETHRTFQKMLMDNPTMRLSSGVCRELELPEPYEFVGQAGDVLFMHHLIFHTGNASHSENRVPRIALHCDAWRDEWLTSIDPDEPNISPWKASLALNGPYTLQYDERALREAHEREQAAKQKSA